MNEFLRLHSRRVQPFFCRFLINQRCEYLDTGHASRVLLVIRAMARQSCFSLKVVNRLSFTDYF